MKKNRSFQFYLVLVREFFGVDLELLRELDLLELFPELEVRGAGVVFVELLLLLFWLLTRVVLFVVSLVDVFGFLVDLIREPEDEPWDEV